jgi:hypothetical protein
MQPCNLLYRGKVVLSNSTVFLMIRKRGRDRRVHERPLKNDRQYDFLS